MGTISVTLPSDGETIDASDINNPINTIVNEINGGLDTNNLDAAAGIVVSQLNLGGAGAGLWWEEIGRTTLSGAGDSISVASLPARKYLKILISVIDTGGTISGRLVFNNDTTATYSARYSSNGGADTTETSNSTGIPFKTTVAEPAIAELVVINIAAQEKLVTGSYTGRGTAGAAAAPNKMDISGKWSNTAAQISRIDVTNAGSGDFAIGSEVIILGHD